MAQHRNRGTFRPWWRLALRFVLLTLFFALAYTYLPDLSSGRPFLVELRSSAILAAAIIAATAVVNAVLDRRDQRREARKAD